MSQLSSYIHNELHSLMKQIQHTPPRKKSSLAKVEALIRTAPIDQDEKDRIRQQIKHVESAIFTAYTPMKSTRTSPNRQNRTHKTDRILQMSQDHQPIRNIVKKKLVKQSLKVNKIEQLKHEYEQLKSVRREKEQYLQKLIIKVQRLERIGHSKAKSARKHRQKQEMTKKYREKQQSLDRLKTDTLLAAKQHRKDVVHKLMQRYNEGMNK